MAKVKITGHASGSGVITVTAPNTSTDRTITLPDATATIATTTDVAARLPSITDGGNATAITIDSSENVGVGVTPSSATGAAKFLHIGSASDAHSALVLQDNTRKWEFQCNDSLSIFAADSEKLKLTSDGRGLSQFTAKAWVNFNGSGTVAIRDSHNVSSITDRGTGQYSVNFSNALDSADYTAGGMSGNITGATGDSRSIQRDGTWTTTVCQIRVTYADGGAGAVVDDSFIGVQVFGG
jgi:hypothetical protein